MKKSHLHLHPGSQIGTQVPWTFIKEAGGVAGVETVALGPGIKAHRRRDGQRWRRPVNGRRGFITSQFVSLKNGHIFVMCESRGEKAMFRYFEIYPPIRAFREQYDIVEIVDDEGLLWAVPDATAQSNDGTVWLEGKYDGSLSDKARARLRRIKAAFANAGLCYAPIDHRWCRHPIVSENVGMVFANRKTFVSPEDSDRIIRLLKRGPSTVQDCVAQLPYHECPEELVCALMARGLIEIDLTTIFSPTTIVSTPNPPFWLEPGDHDE
jgi:hypothetical protein